MSTYPLDTFPRGLVYCSSCGLCRAARSTHSCHPAGDLAASLEEKLLSMGFEAEEIERCFAEPAAYAAKERVQ